LFQPFLRFYGREEGAGDGGELKVSTLLEILRALGQVPSRDSPERVSTLLEILPSPHTSESGHKSHSAVSTLLEILRTPLARPLTLSFASFNPS